MMRRVRDLIVELSMIVALGFALALAIPQANAEMISADRAQAGDERSRALRGRSGRLPLYRFGHAYVAGR